MNAAIEWGRWRPAALPCMRLAVALLVGVLAPHTASALACVQLVSKYEQRGDQIWYVRSNAQNQVANPIASADPRTFRPLPNPTLSQYACMSSDYVEYARDSQGVFFRGQPVRGANPDKFEFINRIYAQDGAGVYAGTQKLTTRVAEFRVIEDSDYATDGLRYFYKDVLLEGTNFQFVSAGQPDYVRTSIRVYYFGEPLEADPESFEVIDPGSEMSKDKSKVFFGSATVENADPSTFQKLALPYWKDRHAVYWKNRAVNRADVSSFEVLAMPLARDKNYTYNQGKVVCRVRQEAPGPENLCKQAPT